MKPGLYGSALALFLVGCAHSYHYLPEIAGEGGQRGPKGEIVYAIPPTGNPELRMTVLSMGIKKSKGTPMVGMRLTFAKSPNAAPHSRYYLDPAEQIVRLGDRKLTPAFVRTQLHQKGLIEISQGHQVVELLYPLPEGSAGAHGVSGFTFDWRVHYGRIGRGFVEEQATRFNRTETAPQQAGLGLYTTDPDYPFRPNLADENDWAVNHDPLWSPFPFQAMP